MTDTLREKIDNIFIEGADQNWEIYNPIKLIDQIVELITAANKEAELKARLVELDLLEQFMNTEVPINTPKEGLLIQYKLNRLKDLNNRLDKVSDLQPSDSEAKSRLSKAQETAELSQLEEQK